MPFLGFGAITLAMMITGGASVALPIVAFVAPLFGAGALWVQRFQDRKDAHSQMQFDVGEVLATPAVLSRPNGPSAQQGELQISRSAVQWAPRPPSREAAFSISREQIAAVSLVPRGFAVKRASLVVDTTEGTFIFVTAARFHRILSGLETIGLPARR